MEGSKGQTARMHDRLVQRVKHVLELVGTYVMENPQGGLEKMWYMADWEDKKRIVELCAFVWPFKKTTNLWTAGFNWQPHGVTGDGRCHEQCGQGSVDRVEFQSKWSQARPEKASGALSQGTLALIAWASALDMHLDMHLHTHAQQNHR